MTVGGEGNRSGDPHVEKRLSSVTSRSVRSESWSPDQAGSDWWSKKVTHGYPRLPFDLVKGVIIVEWIPSGQEEVSGGEGVEWYVVKGRGLNPGSREVIALILRL